MSEGYREAIDKAFNIALIQFGLDNAIDVQIENIDKPTSTDTPFLAGFMIPSATDDADLYFTDRRSGVYQIDVYFDSHTGTGEMNRMIDALNAVFKPSATLERNPICLEITRFYDSRVFVEDGWAKKSVTIEWYTYTTRL